MRSVDGYCVKCRAKRTMSKPVGKRFGKRFAVQGSCPRCGTKMTRFLSEAY